jgi:hypothetical protein
MGPMGPTGMFTIVNLRNVSHGIQIPMSERQALDSRNGPEMDTGERREAILIWGTVGQESIFFCVPCVNSLLFEIDFKAMLDEV